MTTDYKHVKDVWADSLNFLSTGDEIAEFANSLALDEPPHLDLHCLPSGL